MKLSVKRKFGMTQVRGGRVLRVTHAHQVGIKGYDDRYDRETGRKRFADEKWVTTAVGDLAVEVISVKTNNIIAHAYLSGVAIDVVRYTSGTDPVASWFEPARGLNVTFPDNAPSTIAEFVDRMMAIKYGGADIAVARIPIDGKRDMSTQEALGVLASAYSYVDDAKTPSTDFVAMIRPKNGDLGIAHFQTPSRSQTYSIGPFTADVMLSSPDFERHAFERGWQSPAVRS